MRSKYIYLIRIRSTDALLGCFTVKEEARLWAEKHWVNQYYPIERLKLSCMENGLGDKSERETNW